MSKRRTEELLEEIRERADMFFQPQGGELLAFIKRLAEIVDDLETLEAERQEREDERRWRES